MVRTYRRFGSQAGAGKILLAVVVLVAFVAILLLIGR